jgi:hypothetical protein
MNVRGIVDVRGTADERGKKDARDSGCEGHGGRDTRRAHGKSGPYTRAINCHLWGVFMFFVQSIFLWAGVALWKFELYPSRLDQVYVLLEGCYTINNGLKPKGVWVMRVLMSTKPI